MGLLQELEWRGLLQDKTGDIENHLKEGERTGYVGFDPTADSLHIGNLVPIMHLVHLQRAGHTPIALVGGATGMVGDPSGKSNERNLLSEDILNHNVACIQNQLSKFLDFEGENAAKLVNNYDWMKEFSFLEFIRDVGKHISVNYMMSKDSVKNRLETGISFTEFSYQLLQGYDFYHLNKELDCTMQMGGSDQWGNITTGIELCRRKNGTSTHAITAPLLTKADGSKFGKSEGGNVWLDAEKTSPYKFYQFWLNANDDEIEKLLKIFSLKNQDEIITIMAQHFEAPHLRFAQKSLAEELTVRIHSQKDLDNAIAASQILFGKATKEMLASVDESTFLSVFEGVPQFTISKEDLENLNIVDLLAEKTKIQASKGEARRGLKGNAFSVNKTKIGEDYTVSSEDLLNNKYILVGKGKKNNYLVVVD